MESGMDAKGQRNARVVAEIGVSMAVERLLRAGFGVAVPIIDEGYDLIATHGRKAWRLQVKATSVTHGHRSRRIDICKGRKSGRYTKHEVDAFVAIHVANGHAMCVPRKDRGDRHWINFAEHERYSDFRILHKVKPGK